MMFARTRRPAILSLTVAAGLAWSPLAEAADPVVAVAESPTPPATAAPVVDAPAPPDPAEATERARVVSKGQRLVTTGGVFSGIAIIGLAAAAVFSARGDTSGAIGAAGGSVLFAGIGLALVVPGRRRVKTPERYMKSPRVAVSVAPVLSRQVQGAGVAIRF